MNCPSCGIGITFLGDWNNAMQYECARCGYEISMMKKNILRGGKIEQLKERVKEIIQENTPFESYEVVEAMHEIQDILEGKE